MGVGRVTQELTGFDEGFATVTDIEEEDLRGVGANIVEQSFGREKVIVSLKQKQPPLAFEGISEGLVG
jgi:hypothetical protein